jgi:hypothetical protein
MMTDATRTEVVKIAAQRAVALVRILTRKGLTPETVIIPVAHYETGEDYAFFKAMTQDPIMLVMDYPTWIHYNFLVQFGVERQGWKTQRVPIRRAEFDTKAQEWDQAA